MKNTMKKLICSLTVGAALVAAAPVFADSYRDNGRDRQSFRDRNYDRHDRNYDRRDYRFPDRRPVVMVQRPVVMHRPYVVHRPVIVERPVYYSTPASPLVIGAIVGAAIGSIYYHHQ